MGCSRKRAGLALAEDGAFEHRLAAMSSSAFKQHCAALPPETADAHKKLRRMEKNRASAKNSQNNKMAKVAQQTAVNAALRTRVAELEAASASQHASVVDMRDRLAAAHMHVLGAHAASRCRQILEGHAAAHHLATAGIYHVALGGMAQLTN